jgi:hypothetical protein
LCVSAGATVALDDKIGVVLMSATELRVTATVRVAKFAACALLSVVIPDGMVTVQVVSLGSVAVPAVRTNFAVPVPELAAAAPNEVELHPLAEGVIPVMTKLGKVTSILSPTSIATFISKVNATEVAAEVTGLASTSTVFESTGVSEPPIAGDLTIAVGEMSVLSASASATVRLAK